MVEVRRVISSNCTIYEDRDKGYKTGYWTGTTSRSKTRLTVKGDRFNSLAIRDNAVCQNARAKFCAKYGETDNCRASTNTKVNAKEIKKSDPLGAIVKSIPFVGLEIQRKETIQERRKPENRSKICDKACGNLFFDTGCYTAKWDAGCGGSVTFNDIFGDGQLDENKDQVCAQECSAFDVLCKSAKFQVGCGGSDAMLFIIAGMALAGLLMLQLLGR